MEKKKKKDRCLVPSAIRRNAPAMYQVSEYSLVRNFPDREPIVVVKSLARISRIYDATKTVFARFLRRLPNKNVFTEDLTDTSVIVIAHVYPGHIQ